jgi:peptide/nickel transport system substrate-binding protein
VIVVVLVGAGIGFYYLRTHGPGSNSCAIQSRDPIIIDQAEQPDALDPAKTFSTPGWAAVQQVYQGLVQYNGTSSTDFSPVLSQNWSASADNLHWNFTIRSGVTFSNGDPLNAYVIWYSLNRDLMMNQPSVFILTQNFYSPNASYSTNLTNLTAINDTLTSELNSFDFSSPTASQIQVMGAANQSFRVLSPSVIQLNLGNGYLGLTPYHYLLATLSAPNSYAVDPKVVDQHGGVNSSVLGNLWMNVNMLGTGPYTFSGPLVSGATGYALTTNPSYWGAGAAAKEPWNNAIAPAKHAVQVNFQSNDGVTVQDLMDGRASAASFAYLGPSSIQELQGNSCVTVQALPVQFGSTSGAWWIYMNQNTTPFNNLSVREAVVHAINYPQIIQRAFGGFAQQWVGPVPPGYPQYNPANLTPYAFNPALAQQEIQNSPCANGACKGISLNYEYLDLGDWSGVATILQQNLLAINLTINPVKITLQQLYSEQKLDSGGNCVAQQTVAGLGPFPIGQEFYTSDYIAPDDWTQNNAISYGSANQCMSGYSNATVDSLTLTAAGETNPTNLTAEYTQMTNLMYNNYTDAWLCVPTSFAVYNSHLQGYIFNPMASAEPFTLQFNEMYDT